MNNSTHPQLTHRCPPESLTCWFSECKRRVLLALSLAAFHFVTPIHAAIITWSGSAGDTFWSTPGNWSSGSVPGPSDNVIFGNLGASEAPLAIGGAVNNFVDGEILSSINSLRYGNIIGFHNSSLANPLIVRSDSATDVAFVADDGQPSIFFVGSAQADGAADVVYTSITGSSLFVSNVNAGISVMQASATNGPHRATLDMSALNTFTCVVSNILVGHDFGVPITRPVGTLILAVNNSITARLISLGDAYQNAGPISFVHLGQVNTLNVDRIRIALHKCIGTMDFSPGLFAPSVTFRNAAGTGRQLSWEIGDEFEPDTSLGYFTSNQSIGVVDLTGGTVDALVDRIVLGRGQTNAQIRTGDGNGTLTFGAGSINANEVQVGIQMSDGGSVGHGILNIGKDNGVQPAVMTINGNLVMAVQLPGNTDTLGNTAVINLNGGVLEVAGDITDGKGISTINIGSGSMLNLMPTGDTTPGNLAVDTLSLNDGILTNYSTLSATTVSMLGATTEFTVHPGQTLVPGAVGAIGPLNVLGDLTVLGTVDMDISKVNSTLTNDTVGVTGIADLGGTLRVRFSGNSPLAPGDRFTLFGAPNVVLSFTTVILPPAGSGLAWANHILIDGSIEVIATSEPTTPPTLTISGTPTSVQLSWPTTYTSFVLRGQTNALTGGLNNTGWGVVSGVSGNQITLPRNPADSAVFFQLFQQYPTTP